MQLSIKKDIAVAKITPGGPKPTNLAKNIDRGMFKKEIPIEVYVCILIILTPFKNDP